MPTTPFLQCSRLDKQTEDWIRSGIERDERYSPEDIICGVRNGSFQLFRYPKGIVVTQVTGHNRLLVFLVSGEDINEWKAQATEDLRSFAEQFGIEVIEAYCRPGLEKVLRDIGWVKEQVVLRLRKEGQGGSSERKSIRSAGHRHHEEISVGSAGPVSGLRVSEGE